MTRHPNIVPSMRYVDAPAAIDWLCDVFGFERQLVVPNEEGGVLHAQLSFDGGLVMLGSARDDEQGLLVRSPKEVGALTHGVYIVVPAIDEHYERVKAAGAEIVSPIEDQPYGGRLYAARDPEGYLWYFGSYDPWAS